MHYDPLQVNCPHCGMAKGQPCLWPPVTGVGEPPPLYHAERIDLAENGAAMEAAIGGNAADPAEWKAATEAALDDLV